jgi:DNA-binding response OmpR family regulator
MTAMRIKVLVVEDDLLTRDALRRVLEHEGFDVHVVNDGERALVLLEEHRFDAVILDIALPRMSGTDLMEHIAATAPHLLESIVVVTGVDIAEIRKLFPSVCDTLSKPVMPSRLLASIGRCVRGRSGDRHLGIPVA